MTTFPLLAILGSIITGLSISLITAYYKEPNKIKLIYASIIGIGVGFGILLEAMIQILEII